MEDKRVRDRARSALVALALVVPCVSACKGTGTKVRILTEPKSSIVTVREYRADSSESREFRFDKSPIELKLARSRKVAKVALEATAEGFQPATANLTVEEILALPEGPDGYREVRLELSQEYESLPQLVVVYDTDREEFVGRVRRVRAYRKTAEGSGFAVGKVFDQLPEGHGIRGMDISPDGTQLVFAEARPGESDPDAVNPGDNRIIELEACNLKAIKLLDQGGRRIAGGIMHLTSSGYRDVDPTFSPDGAFIRFASNRRRPHHADILQIKSQAREGGVQNIYVDNRSHTALKPSMAADGTTVFALHPPQEGGRAMEAGVQIWSVGGDNPYETEITYGTQPRVSPEGDRIAYIGADKNLWVVHTDGTNPTQLTGRAEVILETYLETLSDEERAGFDRDLFMPYAFPSWGPDGRFILFTSMEGPDPTGRPNEDIWMMPAEGGSPIQLTTNGSSDTNPLMSPDQLFVYFLSNRGGRWAIWSLRVPEELWRKDG